VIKYCPARMCHYLYKRTRRGHGHPHRPRRPPPRLSFSPCRRAPRRRRAPASKMRPFARQPLPPCFGQGDSRGRPDGRLPPGPAGRGSVQSIRTFHRLAKTIIVAKAIGDACKRSLSGDAILNYFRQTMSRRINMVIWCLSSHRLEKGSRTY